MHEITKPLTMYISHVAKNTHTQNDGEEFETKLVWNPITSDYINPKTMNLTQNDVMLVRWGAKGFVTVVNKPYLKNNMMET